VNRVVIKIGDSFYAGDGKWTATLANAKQYDDRIAALFDLPNADLHRGWFFVCAVCGHHPCVLILGANIK